MDSQEETEPLDTDSGFYSQEESQSQTQSQTLAYWGRLYPLKESLPKIDLENNIITFGFRAVGETSANNVLITEEHLPLEIVKKCSRLHFEIQRKTVDVLGAATTKVFIIDKSSNGTFVNGRMLSKKSGIRVLKTNDIIGLPAGKPTRCFEAYVFIDSLMPIATPIPRVVAKKYQMSYRLGVGAFGEVSLVFDKLSGKPYAMKTIVKDSNADGHKVDFHRQKLLNELHILQAVRHPNVIQLVDVLDCRRESYLFLEFMEGKDLSHRLRQSEKLDEDLTKFYFYQIVKGVGYLHNEGITHRDLKPANILLLSTNQETLLKITDFGLSKVVSSATMMKTLCGTKMYVAPEVLHGCGMNNYTQQVDVWSMGVILYYCLSGTEPFAAESNDVEYLIKKGIYSMPTLLWQSISADAKSLIHKMLMNDPNERIKVHEITEDLWMQDNKMIEKINDLYHSVAHSPHNTSEISALYEDGRDQEETTVLPCPENPAPKRMRLN